MIELKGRRVTGTVDARYRTVSDAFESFAADPDFGGQLAVRIAGETVVDLTVGDDVTAETLFPVFSCSKGASAITIGILVDLGLLNLDERVAHYWPEFAAAGKSSMTVRQALSHQAGLVDVDGGLDWSEVMDDQRGAARLAQQVPLWHPGTAQGYHALTLGIIMGELVRRATGESLQHFYEANVRGPRGIDVYLGLPETLDARVRSVDDMTLTPEQQRARDAAALPHPDSIERLPYARTGWDVGGRFRMAGTRSGRAAGMPGAGAFASARGLALLYAEATSGVAGPRLFSEQTELAMAQIQTARTDLVLARRMRFAIAFQKPDPQYSFGSYRAFGHDGACGALGFADPLHGISFGYIPRRMAYPGGCDPRALELAALVSQVARSGSSSD